MPVAAAIQAVSTGSQAGGAAGAGHLFGRRRIMSKNHPAKENPARWRKLRTEIYDAENWRCRSCGRLPGVFELDHIQAGRTRRRPLGSRQPATACVGPAIFPEVGRKSARRGAVHLLHGNC